MFNRAAILLILATGIFHGSAVQATGCQTPPLDSAFETANRVFVARLTSATAVDRFLATATFELEHSLKGDPSEKLTLHASIDPMLHCELDLTIGDSYLIFLNRGQVTLSYDTGSRRIDGRENLLQWIEAH